MADPCNCGRHQELEDVQDRILQHYAQFTPGDITSLDELVSLRQRELKLAALIRVSEENDLSGISKLIDLELAGEVRTLLSKHVDKLDIQNIDWTEYVTAAVTYSSAQSYGSRVEALYGRKNGYKKVSSSDQKGDLFNPVTQKYIEVKFSVLSKPANQINIVQIRPHHQGLDEYHIITFEKETLTTVLYSLDKQQMNDELQLTGHSLAHGTKSTQNSLSHPEYAIRFKKDSPVYNRWQKYVTPHIW